MGEEILPESISAPLTNYRASKGPRKTKGVPPTCRRTRLPGYRRLPVLFAPVVNLSIPTVDAQLSLLCPPAPGGPVAVIQKDGQPALSPPCAAKAAALRAPLTASGKRVRVNG